VELTSLHTSAEDLVNGREALLTNALRAFAGDRDVVGVFLSGSLAAGTADPYSDIDLRVVVRPERHAWFVDHRRDLPKAWPGFLFNEWLPGAQHCVSHFRPFNKVDIFYYAADALRPSSWFTLPVKILHDPHGIVEDLLDRSKGFLFEVAEDEVDCSISKGIAAAHEVYRRAHRGELLYAQTLLDEFRQHIMRADDLLFDRTPHSALHANFDRRGSHAVMAMLSKSFGTYNAVALVSTLTTLVQLYRAQVTKLHDKFELSRPLTNDFAALEILSALISSHRAT